MLTLEQLVADRVRSALLDHVGPEPVAQFRFAVQFGDEMLVAMARAPSAPRRRRAGHSDGWEGVAASCRPLWVEP